MSRNNTTMPAVAAALPPVIVRATGPGGEVRSEYLNIGIDAANAAHLTAPAPAAREARRSDR
jgi:hypothetical protein